MEKTVTVAPEVVQAYREHTFRLLPHLRVRHASDAVGFVNERGFVYFWPIKEVVLPSLWCAVAGDRPVASEHDDPGHVTWGWKDAALGKRQWYYAKVLRGRATLIALDTVPYFYALSENYGDPEHDYLHQYANGLLSNEAKLIYEALLAEGPLDTVRLRRAVRMTNKSSHVPFERGLTELQRDFKILPVGVAETGAWHYSFVYEVVHRHHPDLPERARTITTKVARSKLVSLYLDAVGMATAADVRRLFQWRPEECHATLRALVAQGTLYTGPNDAFISARLVQSLVQAR